MSRRVVRRRREKGKGGFLLGVVVGVAGGLAGVTALLRRADRSEERIAFVDETVTTGPDGITETTSAAIETVQRAPSQATEQIRGALDAVRTRWREAIAAGKAAAAERERELEALLAADTKRVPEIEGRTVLDSPSPPGPRHGGEGGI